MKVTPLTRIFILALTITYFFSIVLGANKEVVKVSSTSNFPTQRLVSVTNIEPSIADVLLSCSSAFYTLVFIVLFFIFGLDAPGPSQPKELTFKERLMQHQERKRAITKATEITPVYVAEPQPPQQPHFDQEMTRYLQQEQQQQQQQKEIVERAYEAAQEEIEKEREEDRKYLTQILAKNEKKLESYNTKESRLQRVTNCLHSAHVNLFSSFRQRQSSIQHQLSIQEEHERVEREMKEKEKKEAEIREKKLLVEKKIQEEVDMLRHSIRIRCNIIDFEERENQKRLYNENRVRIENDILSFEQREKEKCFYNQTRSRIENEIDQSRKRDAERIEKERLRREAAQEAAAAAAAAQNIRFNFNATSPIITQTNNTRLSTFPALNTYSCPSPPVIAPFSISNPFPVATTFPTFPATTSTSSTPSSSSSSSPLSSRRLIFANANRPSRRPPTAARVGSRLRYHS